MRPRLVILLALLVLAPTAGCGGATSHSSGALTVVAAENFWGSVAEQLGGNRVSVISIVTNPATDPHDYEPRPSDARAVALARVAIVNGAGYDPWATNLLAADPSTDRIVVDAGDLLGVKRGGNPHLWYSPAAVRRVAAAIVAGYVAADPAGAAYYAVREHHFETRLLARYDALRTEIRRRFTGTAVGASESIFEPLAADLGLRILTPQGFLNALSEGAELGARDAQTVERQARDHLIAVWVQNSQNLTPEVTHITAIARSRHIPVVSVTETLSPATASFEQWQVAQLEQLLAALHRATGR